MEIENKFHTKQDGKSIIFHVLDTDDSQLKKYDPEKSYYWFKSQKILVTQGGSSGSLLNGQYESFYKNNQLAEKGAFKKGLKDGIWKFWGENGTLIHQEKWRKGIRIGKQFYYSKEGILQKTIIFKSQHTRIISRDTTILEARKTTSVTVRDSLGKLISQSRYKNGLLDGTQLYRDQNDSIVKTTYKRGELVPAKAKKEKNGKAEPADALSGKKSFKDRMKNFWRKISFWKKKEATTPDPKPEKEKRKNKETPESGKKKKVKE